MLSCKGTKIKSHANPQKTILNQVNKEAELTTLRYESMELHSSALTINRFKGILIVLSVSEIRYDRRDYVIAYKNGQSTLKEY